MPFLCVFIYLFICGLCCDFFVFKFFVVFFFPRRGYLFFYLFIHIMGEEILLCCPHPNMESSILLHAVQGTFVFSCAHMRAYTHTYTQDPTAERGIIPLISAKASGAQTAARCRNRRRHLQHNSVLRTSSSSCSSPSLPSSASFSSPSSWLSFNVKDNQVFV